MSADSLPIKSLANNDNLRVKRAAKVEVRAAVITVSTGKITRWYEIAGRLSEEQAGEKAEELKVRWLALEYNPEQADALLDNVHAISRKARQKGIAFSRLVVFAPAGRIALKDSSRMKGAFADAGASFNKLEKDETVETAFAQFDELMARIDMEARIDEEENGVQRARANTSFAEGAAMGMAANAAEAAEAEWHAAAGELQQLARVSVSAEELHNYAIAISEAGEAEEEEGAQVAAHEILVEAAM